MKHHFGDLLDRDGDYWTIVPNRERYAYSIGNVPSNSKEITIATIGKDDPHWEHVLSFPNLEELTLHEPVREQLEMLANFKSLERLRITHARPKDIEFLSQAVNVKELVLEYVSGFADLSPLGRLGNLRSLHMENLRRVSDFGGLAGLHSLKYLHIDGTLDWKQPIDDFEFLSGLPNLEVFSLGQVINKTPFPALLPLVRLKNLQKIRIQDHMFPSEEYALLEVGLPNVTGAKRDIHGRWTYKYIDLDSSDIRTRLPEETIRANHPEVQIWYNGTRKIADPDSQYFEFVGKGAGRVKCTSGQAKKKCDEFSRKYAAMIENAKKVIGKL